MDNIIEENSVRENDIKFTEKIVVSDNALRWFHRKPYYLEQNYLVEENKGE